MSITVKIPPLPEGIPMLKPPPSPGVPLAMSGMDPMMDRKVNERPYRGCCGK
jgi:hypothetical protein